ncbi:LuxR C-terminal-related transcriptional regulator [Streptomyces sp. NPDC035033]|uniref:helix-turn-helix transcriptional regulator n=1 Tax=Streptomyces sp. NPDC035033 TaxID=3155368 RepID=UPI00340C1C66
MTTTEVALIADDPITAAGIGGLLTHKDGLRFLPAADGVPADVVLVVAFALGGDVLARLRAAVTSAHDPYVPVVVASDGLSREQYERASAERLLVLLDRRSTTFAEVRRAVRDQAAAAALRRAGTPETGPPVRPTGDVLDELFPEDSPPHGGLLHREIRVLRLLALGRTTEEIAEELNFSQRTIKAIIHDMLVRMHLRNRQHAVAYAIRHSVL